MRSRLLTALAIILASGPAAAQDGDVAVMQYVNNTDNLDRAAISLQPEQARKIYAAAVCVTKGVQVGDWYLQDLPDSKEDRKHLFARAFWSVSCGEQELVRYSVPMFERGVAAEQLYKRDFIAPAEGKRNAVKIYVALDPQARSQQRKNVQQAMSYIDFGACVAGAAPEGVNAVLAAPVYSAAESAALRALQPAMADCIAPTMQMRMSGLLMRGFLAEGAYRRAALKVSGGRHDA